MNYKKIKLFICPFCGRSFKRFNDLVCHAKMKHSQESLEIPYRYIITNQNNFTEDEIAKAALALYIRRTTRRPTKLREQAREILFTFSNF